MKITYEEIADRYCIEKFGHHFQNSIFRCLVRDVQYKEIAERYAEAYHEAKMEQKQHLVELMKMDEGNDGEQCFILSDTEGILAEADHIIPKELLNHLNRRAEEYATDRAKKVLETFSKEYELTVGGSLMMRIRISEQLIEVVGAVDGYGYSVVDQISIIEITDPKNLEV